METTTTIPDISPLVTQADLVSALQGAMVAPFGLFKKRLAKQDGLVLDVRITAKGNNINLEYGINPIK